MSYFEINRHLAGAYTISPQLVEEIATKVTEAVGAAPSVTLQFRNGRNLSSPDIRFIHDSSVGVEILETVSLYASNNSKICHIVFGWSLSAPIYMLIKLPRLEAQDLDSTVENLLQANATWYSPLFRAKQTGISTQTVLASATVLIGLMMIGAIHYPSLMTEYAGKPVLGLILLIILNGMTDLLLPATIFAIGRSGRRASNRRSLFNILAVAIVLGTLVNLWSGWLAKQFNLG